MHSTADRHAIPFAFWVRQAPDAVSQYRPLEHGCVASQPPAHLVVSAHRLLAHVAVAAVLQAPAPVHTDAVDAIPFAQEPGAHSCSAPGYWQRTASTPLHCPLHASVPTQGVRVPRGAPMTGKHFPGVPPLQASH